MVRLIMVFATLLLIGCEKVPQQFKYGDFVEFKLNGQKGQIVGGVNCNKYTCFYNVRVSVVQSKTNTHLFTDDGPIESYAPVLLHGIRQYELKAAEW